MTIGGMELRSTGTLVDRALAYLGRGPAASDAVAADILGLKGAPPLITERVASALLGADPRVRRLVDGRWALVPHSASSPRLADVSFAVVDVETTGSSPRRGDRIIEIAVVAVSNGTIALGCDALVNPERPIPRAITGLTSISSDMVRRQPVFAEIADQVTSALSGRVFVAHNMHYDWSFVTAELRRARDLALDGPRLCTVRLARRLVPGLKSRTLDSLARYFGVEIAQRHRAGSDALATARILERLLELAIDQGVKTLNDLEAFGRGRSGRATRRKRKKRSALPTSMEEL